MYRQSHSIHIRVHLIFEFHLTLFFSSYKLFSFFLQSSSNKYANWSRGKFRLHLFGSLWWRWRWCPARNCCRSKRQDSRTWDHFVWTALCGQCPTFACAWNPLVQRWPSHRPSWGSFQLQRFVESHTVSVWSRFQASRRLFLPGPIENRWPKIGKLNF